MKIYYVINTVYDDDEPLISETRFFQSKEKAQKHADELDNKRLASWKANEKHRKEKWELEEIAIEALERANIDWRVGFPYHKRTWVTVPFTRNYEVESLEVE